MMDHTRDNLSGQVPQARAVANIASVDAGDSFVQAVCNALGQLLPGGDNRSVLVGVSAGVDSVSLLGAMAAIFCAKALNIDVYVAHLNHGLREQSAAEAGFVRQLAGVLNLQCVTESIDVQGYARRSACGLEQAARHCRYKFFARVATELGCDAVAVAHHRDDQVETVLHRVLRGTGIKGLAGMPDVRELGFGSDALLIRPMLGLSRADVLAFANRWSLPWCEDLSNADSRFTRNRIRHELLPFLRDKFNASVDDAVTRLAQNASAAASSISELAASDFENILISDQNENDAGSVGRLSLKIDRLKKIGRPRASEVLRLALQRIGADMGRVTQENIFAMLDAPGGNGVDLPGGLHARSDDGQLIIAIKPTISTVGPELKKLCETPVTEVKKSGTTVLEDKSVLEISACDMDFSHRDIFLKKLKSRKPATAASPVYEEFIDAASLKGGLVVRRRAIGDKFHPLGCAGKQKLKDFFNSLGIAPDSRGQWWCICDEAGIIWVAGLRIADRVKIREKTDKFLRLSLSVR